MVSPSSAVVMYDDSTDSSWLFNNSTDSDVIFLVENERYFAHKTILCNASKYFASLLQGGFASSMNGFSLEVEIRDYQPDVFKRILEFIYTNNIADLHSLSEYLSWGLLEASVFYKLPNLQRKVELHIVQNLLNASTVLHFLKYAMDYHAPYLMRKCSDYLEQHRDEVNKTIRMQTYPPIMPDSNINTKKPYGENVQVASHSFLQDLTTGVDDDELSAFLNNGTNDISNPKKNNDISAQFQEHILQSDLLTNASANAQLSNTPARKQQQPPSNNNNTNNNNNNNNPSSQQRLKDPLLDTNSPFPFNTNGSMFNYYNSNNNNNNSIIQQNNPMNNPFNNNPLSSRYPPHVISAMTNPNINPAMMASLMSASNPVMNPLLMSSNSLSALQNLPGLSLNDPMNSDPLTTSDDVIPTTFQRYPLMYDPNNNSNSTNTLASTLFNSTESMTSPSPFVTSPSLPLTLASPITTKSDLTNSPEMTSSPSVTPTPSNPIRLTSRHFDTPTWVKTQEKMAIVIDLARDAIGAEIGTLFLHDCNTDELVAHIAHPEPINIAIPSKLGIAGTCFTQKEPILSDSPYRDNRFYSGIDMQTGRPTLAILAVPVFAKDSNDTIGVVELLNKKKTTGFAKENIAELQLISKMIASLAEQAFREISRRDANDAALQQQQQRYQLDHSSSMATNSNAAQMGGSGGHANVSVAQLMQNQAAQNQQQRRAQELKRNWLNMNPSTSTTMTSPTTANLASQMLMPSQDEDPITKRTKLKRQYKKLPILHFKQPPPPPQSQQQQSSQNQQQQGSNQNNQQKDTNK